jgi:hypothetical protein
MMNLCTQRCAEGAHSSDSCEAESDAAEQREAAENSFGL